MTRRIASRPPRPTGWAPAPSTSRRARCLTSCTRSLRNRPRWMATRRRCAKIGPHKLIWPAYWGTISEDGKVRPLDLTTVKNVVAPALKGLAFTAAGTWAEIKEAQSDRACSRLWPARSRTASPCMSRAARCTGSMRMARSPSTRTIRRRRRTRGRSRTTFGRRANPSGSASARSAIPRRRRSSSGRSLWIRRSPPSAI